MKNLKCTFNAVEDENEANFERWRTQAAKFQADCHEMRERCKLLTGSDRVLMEMFIQGDHSCLQLAKLLGKSHSSVTRRVRQLTAIILGRAGRKVRFQGALKPMETAVVRLAVVQRLSKRQIMLRMGLSCYRINQIYRKLGIDARKSAIGGTR